MKKLTCIVLILMMILGLSTGSFSMTVNKNNAPASFGDVNRDGGVNNKDIVSLFRLLSESSPEYDRACDINGDGSLNNKDTALLFKFANGSDIEVADGFFDEPEVCAERIVFSAASDKNILSYFVNTRYCGVELVEDDEEGGAVRILAKNIYNAHARTPSVFFDYKGFCDAIEEESISLADKPYVVLKVKAGIVHDRLFSILGASEPYENVSARTELNATVPNGNGWNYIGFDFSDVADKGELGAFRFCFEQLANGSGDNFLISEFRICSKEEAEAIITHDIFPLNERTAENYGLKVLQFNVQTENGNTTPMGFRAEMYRELVEELQPDVVGMQEVTVLWKQWLDKYVFNESYSNVGYLMEGLEGTPVYYRSDKFELLDSGTFWLSDTPDVPYSTIEGTNYPRICTWVVLKDKVTGTQFAFMNTHLDHNGKNDSSTGSTIRHEETKIIVKFAQRFKDMPLFLTGDLNTRRTKSDGSFYGVIRLLSGITTVKDENGNKVKLELSDARLDAPVTVADNYKASMCKYLIPTDTNYDPGREPIDYVFYDAKTVKALTYETFLIVRDGYYLSDHVPLFATFYINPTE